MDRHQHYHESPLELSALPVGTILADRYCIETAISHDDFGSVYRALDQTFQRTVALKEAFSADEETRAQFTFAAQVLMNLTHPGIVHGYGVFERANRLYLIEQYIEGPNLEEVQIQSFKQMRRPIPQETVLQIMRTVCLAVEELHSRDILLRRLKPSLIKISAEDKPILLNPGFAPYQAPIAFDIRAHLTFSVGYAAPEQIQEEGVASKLSDIYALGAITFYALTGRQPWESLKRLAQLHQHRPDMPAPGQFVADIIPAVDSLVIPAMALKPDERFPSAAVMKDAIDEALRALHHRP